MLEEKGSNPIVERLIIEYVKSGVSGLRRSATIAEMARDLDASYSEIEQSVEKLIKDNRLDRYHTGFVYSYCLKVMEEGTNA